MIIPDLAASRALIFAPHGRDASVAHAVLEGAGIRSVICANLLELEGLMDEETCFAVITEEALQGADLRGIQARLKAQPAWSDLPFIILTRRASAVERRYDGPEYYEIAGNITFLERPFHPKTFVSVARTAAKGRQRQFEARKRMEELHEGEERLRQLNETLEKRVAARTAELITAHAKVLAEIEQRERAEEQLRQAQKMEMIGQLTGGVAHDFNNLLMAVLGNLDLLRKHLPDDPRTTRLIDGALQGAQRGAALTQRLLAFARRQDLTVEPKNLGELVRGAADLIERSAGAQTELRLDIPSDIPPTLVDTSQIELAVLNLVVNARDAMPNGGTLSITIDHLEAPSTAELPAGHYVRLVVSDTGCGMDAKTLQKATEPFFSTKGLGKGTGLGLSMVHGLAVQLNGALRLSSQIGIGTSAELWLPVTNIAADEDKPAVAEPETGATERMTILVVDDDVLVAMSTVDMLEDLGHDVIEASSGDRALEILRDDRPVDLLVTDYLMPRMNGAQLAAAARKIRPELPVLLATGYAELPADSAYDLPRIGKPYRQDQLAAEIGKVLKHGSTREASR